MDCAVSPGNVTNVRSRVRVGEGFSKEFEAKVWVHQIRTQSLALHHCAGYLSYRTSGHVYSSCVRSAMLHASETWPFTKTNLQRLQRNDRAMIRQICSIKPEDVARVRSSELLAKLQLEDLDLILRERRLPWFGMWSVRVVQSEQHMICRLTASGGREAQANMEETDREGLP